MVRRSEHLRSIDRLLRERPIVASLGARPLREKRRTSKVKKLVEEAHREYAAVFRRLAK